MKFVAEIDIMPHKELLDPQGKAVATGLKRLNLNNVSDARVGKHIHLIVETNTKQEAEAEVDMACKKLLANPIMESYRFEIKEI